MTIIARIVSARPGAHPPPAAATRTGPSSSHATTLTTISPTAGTSTSVASSRRLSAIGVTITADAMNPYTSPGWNVTSRETMTARTDTITAVPYSLIEALAR